MGPKALLFLESRRLVNAIRRLRTEPRRLLALVPLALVALRIWVHASPAADLSPVIEGWSGLLGHLLVWGWLVRLTWPAIPLYYSEPADLGFLVPAVLPPRTLFLRHVWLTVERYARSLLGLVFGLVWWAPNREVFALLALLGVYVLVLEQLGLLAYRLARGQRARVPIRAVALGLLLADAVYTVSPTVTGVNPATWDLRRLAPDPVAGAVSGVLQLVWSDLFLLLAGAGVLVLVNWRWAPALAPEDFGVVLRRARIRAAVAEGHTRPAPAHATSRTTTRQRTARPWPLRLRGAGVIAEIHVRLLGRRLLLERWRLVLLAAGVAWGITAARLGHGAPTLTLAAAAYVSLLVLSQSPVLLTNPLVAGAPRTARMVAAEQTGGLLGVTGFWLVMWTAAGLAGLPSAEDWMGYAVILTTGLISSAVRLYIWSWFPELSIRSVAGRLVTLAAGLLGYGIASLGLLAGGPVLGPVAAFGLAVAETWALNHGTARRLARAASLARTYGVEV